MDVGSTLNTTYVNQSVQGLFRRAERSMLSAVESVNRGEIIDAVISTMEAEISAKSASAIAKVEREVHGALLDILA